MEREKKEIVLFVAGFLIALGSFGQKCGSINNFLRGKKIYVLDTTLAISYETLSEGVKDKDSALIKQILKNGEKTSDFLSFFSEKNIPISLVASQEFLNVQNEEVKLSDKEKRILSEQDSLWKKLRHAQVKNQSTKIIERKLSKRKFQRLNAKIHAGRPVLLIIFPIYKYLNYTLILYFDYWSRDSSPVSYDLCKDK